MYQKNQGQREAKLVLKQSVYLDIDWNGAFSLPQKFTDNLTDVKVYGILDKKIER